MVYLYKVYFCMVDYIWVYKYTAMSESLYYKRISKHFGVENKNE